MTNLIQGPARRELKRELSRLKRFVAWYWHFEYLDSIDTVESDPQHKIYFEAKEKIKEIEKMLTTPHE